MKKVETLKPRLEWIDLAKGIAIICIIFGHAMEWADSTIGVKLLLLPAVYSFTVPLFFFLSGYVFFVKNITFVQHLKKKSKGILIPYAFFAFAYVCADAVKIYLLNTKDDISVLGGIKQFIIQEHYTHLWFLAVLFLVEVIAYWICKIEKKTVIAVIAVVFAAVALLHYRYIKTWLPWSIDEIPYAMPFFLLGYVVKEAKIDDKLFDFKLFPVYILISIASTFINSKINPEFTYINMWKLYFGTLLLFYISAVAAIFGIIAICKKVKHARMTKYIGKNSLVYYGLHLILITFFTHFVRYIPLSSDILYLAICLAETVAILLVLTPANIILTKTPLSIFIGKGYKKSK